MARLSTQNLTPPPSAELASFKQHRGFTFIELLTTVFILAITLKFGLPNLKHQIANYKLKQAAQTHLELLRLTQITAIQHGTEYHLCGSSDGVNCNNSKNNWGPFLLIKQSANDSLLSVSTLDSTIRVSNNRKAEIKFGATGWGSAAMSSFYFCSTLSDNHGYKIIIQMSGHFRLETMAHPKTACVVN